MARQTSGSPPARCRRPGHGRHAGRLWSEIARHRNGSAIESSVPASMSEERTARASPCQIGPTDGRRAGRSIPGPLRSKLVDVPRRAKADTSNAQNVSVKTRARRIQGSHAGSGTARGAVSGIRADGGVTPSRRRASSRAARRGGVAFEEDRCNAGALPLGHRGRRRAPGRSRLCHSGATYRGPRTRPRPGALRVDPASREPNVPTNRSSTRAT